MALQPLGPDALYRPCPLRALPFETTDELPEIDEPVGQERALAALQLAVSIRGDGFHAFVAGPPGVGKRTFLRRFLARHAAGEPVPSDWCYVHDFADPQRPRALELPAGRAAPFRHDMEQLVDGLRASIPAVFEGEDYRARLRVLEKEAERKREEATAAVQRRAEERHLTIVRTPMGFMVAPVREGEVIDPEHFRQLPPDEQRGFQEAIAATQQEMQDVLRRLPQIDRDHRERVKELNREVALYAAGHLVDELRARYADLPQVVAYVDAVQADVGENVHDFAEAANGEDTATQLRRALSQAPAFHRYGVNVLVDHAGAGGAPVVDEDLPTYGNLLGRIEHQAQFGTLVTDYSLLRPGALHRANGGYLVLDARRLLSQPFAWESLKRALWAKEIRMESPEKVYGLSPGATLDPRPIPLKVKVVLVGERLLYHLLATYDPDFLEQFKIVAEFEDEVDRAASEPAYARLVGTMARRDGLRPLGRDAVARVIEHAARCAGDGERLTARVRIIEDLVREADACAAAARRAVVTRADVQGALDAQLRRHGRLRERILEAIARGTVLIDTEGAKVAQVNALSVIDAGGVAFGRPSRITARVRLGKGEVVDVERQVELGGPIHSKGVLILAGLLGSRFAPDHPLALSATLVFEQSYSGVEGDSASCAELYALLSALSGVPIRQALAVTGSVNQAGQVQAIGGVNEKIEGFFDVCRERGLSGNQGVLIPHANVKDLMLRDDVVQSCSAGRFHVWAVDDMDEGIEVLTGIPAGRRGPDGTFPPGTVNARVEARLAELAELARSFGEPRDPATGRR